MSSTPITFPAYRGRDSIDDEPGNYVVTDVVSTAGDHSDYPRRQMHSIITYDEGTPEAEAGPRFSIGAHYDEITREGLHALIAELQHLDSLAP